MFDEFITIEENNLHFVVHANNDHEDQKYTKLKTRDGKHFVSHKSIEFINFLISDLRRMGFPEINDNGAIKDDDIPFSAYYIFNNQKLVERKTILNELLPRAILNDRILIQTFNGPPLEMHQLDRLMPVRDELEKVIGKSIFKNITEYAWGTYYKSMLQSDDDSSIDQVFYDYKLGKEVDSNNFNAKNWDGPGKHIEEKDFIKTEDFKEIKNHFESLSDEQLAVIFSLFFWNEKLSILNIFLLIKGAIPKSVFIDGMLGINHEVLDGLYMLEETKDINRHLSQAYSFYNDDVSIAIEYLERSGFFDDADYKKFIKKLILNHENKTTELKTSFFRCQNSKNKDITIMHEAIKAIAGFQNASGGHLLIGVNDEGDVLGLQNIDEYKDSDTYTQRIEQHIGKCLGQTSLSKLIIRFVEVNKELICHIEVKTSLPTFCKDRAYNKKTKKPEDDSLFYLRQNNMTVVLNAEETINYIAKVNS